MFDLEAARQSGASDDQISDFLAQKFNFDINSARNSGASNTQIAEFLSAKEQQPFTEQQLLEAGAVPGTAITDEQLETIRAGGKITPQVTTLPEQASGMKLFQAPEPGTQLESLGAGVRRGVQAIGTAGAKGLAAITGNEKLAKKLEIGAGRDEDINRAVSENFPLTNLAGQIIGEVGALPLPGAVGKTLTTKLATAAGVGAVAGGASAAGRNEDVITGALAGAGFSAGFQGLTEAGKQVAIRLINAKGGKFATEEISELMKFSKDNNLPIFADDVSKSAIVEKAGVAAENIPLVGTFGGRKKQNIAQEIAAKKIVNDFSGGFEDFAVEAQKGLANKLKTLKGIRKKLFDKSAIELDPLGEIPIDDFRKVIQSQIDNELQRGTRANQNVIKILESFRDAPGGNFSVIRELRNDLGDEISDFFKADNKAIGARGVEKLQAAKDALNQSIERFAGGVKGKKTFKQAMDFSRDRITIPFKKTALKNLVKTDQPEKIIALLRSGASQATKGRKSTANLLFNSLDSKGRGAVQAALLGEAFNKATEGRKVFSANVFAGELEKLQNITGKFFRGKDKARLNGLVKYMRATGRAGQIMENPPTGARLLIPATLLGTSFADSGISLGGVAAFGLSTKIMLQSTFGKAILLGFNKSTPGTKSWEFWMNQLGKFATREEITRRNN